MQDEELLHYQCFSININKKTIFTYFILKLESML